MDFLVNWIVNTPGFAVPYALAALGLIISEKSGVLSLGAEGFMLMGAMAGVGAVIVLGGHPLLALVVAALAAALVSLVFALLVVGMRVNQVIAGLAMVFLCQGLTSLIAAKQGWTSRAIVGLGAEPIWPLSEIPVIGRIFFQQDIVVYLTIPIFIAVQWVLTRTEIGLRLRAVGENPEAADATGINVSLYRTGAVVCGAALVGLAGGYLSVAVAKIWVDGHGQRPRLDRHRARHLRPLAPLAGSPRRHPLRLHRGADPARRRRRHPGAAIFHADDALSRDARGHGLGRPLRRNALGRAGRPRPAACARGTALSHR